MGKGERDPKTYFLATVTYVDGQKLGRLYTSREEAEQFAEQERARRKVESVTVEPVDSASKLPRKVDPDALIN
jgi:hypothetical protein